MPAKSKSEQRLFGAALGGASFPLARKLRAHLSMSQIRDFASTKTKGLPTRVKKRAQ